MAIRSTRFIARVCCFFLFFKLQFLFGNVVVLILVDTTVNRDGGEDTTAVGASSIWSYFIQRSLKQILLSAPSARAKCTSSASSTSVRSSKKFFNT